MDIAEKRNKSYAKKKPVEKSIFITINRKPSPPLPLNELTF